MKHFLKLCITILRQCKLSFLTVFCRPVVIENGMWDQIRVDGGSEFYLILHVQEMLSSHRTNTDCPPFVQTPSTEVIKNVLVYLQL